MDERPSIAGSSLIGVPPPSGAFRIADRAYVMETGRIVREGNAAELQQDADVRKAYLGVQ